MEWRGGALMKFVSGYWKIERAENEVKAGLRMVCNE
jgi:hypothetical protein